MVSPKDVISDQMQRGSFLLNTFTKDLSDAEYFQPAVPQSNHAAWVVGHLACSEDWGRWLLSGIPKRIDDATHALFKGGSVCLPDASKYPSRQSLDSLFAESRKLLLDTLTDFDVTSWNEPVPQHGPRKQFPTLGALWSLMGFHQFWHIGQLTTCRKALGKKAMLA